MGNNNPKLTPKEQMRENKRQIRRAQRELDRERNKLQAEERKTVQELKRMAKQNQVGPLKIRARDLVRMRNQITKFYTMSSHLKSVEMRLQTMSSTQQMSETLGQASRAMVAFNKQMNLPEINKMLQEFSRENQRMEMTEEMMDDAMGMAFENEDDVEASDQVVNEVLGEIGIQIDGELDHGPVKKLPQQEQEEQKNANMEDLESRFNALK